MLVVWLNFEPHLEPEVFIVILLLQSFGKRGARYQKRSTQTGKTGRQNVLFMYAIRPYCCEFHFPLLSLQETVGAFHSTKISGNSGPKLNGTVLSNRKFFAKEGPPFKVDRFFRSDRSDGKLLFHSKKFRFAVPLCRKFLEISVRN